MFRHDPQLCPHCGHKLDAMTGLTDPTPRDGDVPVCAYCLATLLFEGGRLRLPTAEEFRSMMANESLWRDLTEARARCRLQQEKRDEERRRAN